MYDEHSTYSSQQFLLGLVAHAPFMIREIQTDNGTEFTKQLLTNDPNDKTLFEQELEKFGIIYHRIRPATPRHNGKLYFPVKVGSYFPATFCFFSQLPWAGKSPSFP